MGWQGAASDHSACKYDGVSDIIAGFHFWGYGLRGLAYEWGGIRQRKRKQCMNTSWAEKRRDETSTSAKRRQDVLLAASKLAWKVTRQGMTAVPFQWLYQGSRVTRPNSKTH